MNKVGVSQKAIISNGEGKFLTMHRTETAPVRPLTWDFPGGDLDFGEDAVEGMRREIKEETGLDVEDLVPFDVDSRVNKDGDFWVTIAYRAKAVSEKVKLSFEHDKFKWVSVGEFLELESAEKLRRFAGNLQKTGSNVV